MHIIRGRPETSWWWSKGQLAIGLAVIVAIICFICSARVRKLGISCLSLFFNVTLDLQLMGLELVGNIANYLINGLDHHGDTLILGGVMSLGMEILNFIGIGNGKTASVVTTCLGCSWRQWRININKGVH
uniref:Uncharacterized protein n=1 Tax=Romanomermis culicivorax TaxID=13658 RepID=A0A915JIH5_ROMCU